MKTNFHTHTYRCGHAVGAERDYVEAAAQAGFELLGMSDHTPWPVPGVGMQAGELGDYVAELKQLRGEYAGKLELKIGLECEYWAENMNWLRDQIAEHGIDYIIMGSHFGNVRGERAYFGAVTDRDGLRSYLDHTVAGLETGMYSYLAHPELCLRAYPQWDKAVEDTCRQLARACRDLNVPVEYNLEGLRANRKGNHPGLGYPYRRFWDIAAEEGCIAAIGYDAHMPETLLDDTDFEMARRLIENELGMKRIETIF